MLSLDNYLKISDKLHTSAQPTVEDFEGIRKTGVKIVINLARADSPNAISNEAQIVQEKEMKYINIPVDFENPTIDDLLLFFEAMNKFSDESIMVHCACNWRVSCFVYLYRILKLNCNNEIAKKDMLSIWQPNEVWQTFIDDCLSRNELSES